MIALVSTLIGGNLLLGLVQLFQFINGRKKVTAESDAIFVDTAKEIIILLKEEGRSKDLKIFELTEKIARLEARIAILEESK